jgi:hypothetical protein
VDLAWQPSVSDTWRFGGETPSLDDTYRFLWSGVSLQLVVRARTTGQDLGLLQLYNVDWASRHGYVSMVLTAEARLLGWPLESVVLLADYCFVELGLRKLYFDSAESVVQRFRASVGTWLQSEAVHPDRIINHDGSTEDSYLLALDGSLWDHDFIGSLFGAPQQMTDSARA